MAVNTGNKMTNDEIARRYDGEVDRFSDLTVGQETTVDSPLNLRLLAAAASRATPAAATLLDSGIRRRKRLFVGSPAPAITVLYAR